MSGLKTGKITWLGTKFFRVFQFLPLGLGRAERRWMPGMPEAVIRIPLDTLTMEGASQGVNQRILKLISSKRSCLLGNNINSYSIKKYFLKKHFTTNTLNSIGDDIGWKDTIISHALKSNS